MLNDRDLLTLYCCMIKFPQILQLNTINIYCLTQLQKVEAPVWFCWIIMVPLWAPHEVAVKLLGRAGSCRMAQWGWETCSSSHTWLLAGGFISSPQRGPFSIGPQGCSQHGSSLPPKARGKRKNESKKNIKTKAAVPFITNLRDEWHTITSAICCWSHSPALVHVGGSYIHKGVNELTGNSLGGCLRQCCFIM